MSQFFDITEPNFEFLENSRELIFRSSSGLNFAFKEKETMGTQPKRWSWDLGKRHHYSIKSHKYLFWRKCILRDGIKSHKFFIPNNTENIIENTHLCQGTSQIVPH